MANRQLIMYDNIRLIENILGTENEKWLGGVKRFERISNNDLEELKRANILDENERQNNAPSIRELREVASELEKIGGVRISFDGYLVDPARSDSRISINQFRMQVPKDLVTIDLENKFAVVAKSADHFNRLEDDGLITYEIWWD